MYLIYYLIKVHNSMPIFFCIFDLFLILFDIIFLNSFLKQCFASFAGKAKTARTLVRAIFLV